MLLEWINPIYLDISYQEQIQEDFEDSSEIQLKGFLKVTSKNSFPPTQYCSWKFLFTDDLQMKHA